MNETREKMNYDVVIVGAGPSGLSAGIKIKNCVKITGFVNSTENFEDQPKVINGASDLIASVFGDAGMHTRAAVSVNSLPLGVAVEVDAIFELN